MSERQIPLFGPPGAPTSEGPARARPEAPAGDGRSPSPRAPRGRTPETAVSVSELNAAARAALEAGIGSVWVVGEVAGWREAPSGHCYFGLRDDAAQVECVMFRADARRLPAHPEEGMEVWAYGGVSLFEARGRYQLVVRTLEARGEGLWRLAFERLRRTLAAEGLLDPGRKRPLPTLPRRVAVVTSRAGAAVRDVITVVRRRAPWTDVLVCDCRVQGDGAAPGIRAALARAGAAAGVDLVILARGGGSVEDLWCFNDEGVARAVAGSPVPVISAVGHETDVTIVDLVADVRAATPSAAAELAVPEAAELRRRVRRLARSLAAGLRERARRGEERSARAEERLLAAVRGRIERLDGRLARAAARLEALSPLATLRRGYAVALTPDGTVLRRTEMFRPGAPFRLRVSDGEVDARTEETRAERPGA